MSSIALNSLALLTGGNAADSSGAIGDSDGGGRAKSVGEMQLQLQRYQDGGEKSEFRCHLGSCCLCRLIELSRSSFPFIEEQWKMNYIEI